jgi:hypothetical protein
LNAPGVKTSQYAESANAASEAADFVGLAWRCGSLSVQRLGGMLAPLTFILEDGRQVSPLYLAPWAAQETPPALPEILRNLRGEWPCVPFGSYRPKDGFPLDWAAVIGSGDEDPYLHGFGSNVKWNWSKVTPYEVELSCRYPPNDAIEELVRRITPVPDRAAVDMELLVKPRRRTRLPVGLHFTFCKPRTRAILRPGVFREAWTGPGPPYEEVQAFAPDCRFQDLRRTPARGGGYIDATTFPLPVPAEDLIQLNGVDGQFAIDLPGDNSRVCLSWNHEHFPSVLLWMSNLGLRRPPWNGEHVALGVEPVCSAFGLGLEATRNENPLSRSGINTVIEFDPARPFRTTYRISATVLSDSAAL